MKFGLLGALAAFALPAWGGSLSSLAEPPCWSSLDVYQQTITRADFLRLVNDLYSPSGGFWKYARLDDTGVTVYAESDQVAPVFRLTFAVDDEALRARPSRPIRASVSTAEKPLQGRRICLDPGHLGGEFATMEERSFRLDGDPPVEEAQLNLWTALHLEHLLQAAGAEVVWTKKTLGATTSLRPGDLDLAAFNALFRAGVRGAIPAWAQAEEPVIQRAQRLFYLTAEIQARARRVAQLQPDLTLCIHFNAAPWHGTPTREKIVPSSRLVVFVHGCYEDNELAYDDQRFALLNKLLENCSKEEETGARLVATALARRFQMEPEIYSGWTAVKRVGPSPYVFARNLSASRLFPGPVVYAEGPYMNALDAYARLIAGDYEGKREIQGRIYQSIFRDYAEALAEGVFHYFADSSF